MKTRGWAFEGSLSLLFPKVLEQCECGRGFRGLGAAVPQGDVTVRGGRDTLVGISGFIFDIG